MWGSGCLPWFVEARGLLVASPTLKCAECSLAGRGPAGPRSLSSVLSPPLGPPCLQGLWGLQLPGARLLQHKAPRADGRRGPGELVSQVTGPGPVAASASLTVHRASALLLDTPHGASLRGCSTLPLLHPILRLVEECLCPCSVCPCLQKLPPTPASRRGPLPGPSLALVGGSWAYPWLGVGVQGTRDTRRGFGPVLVPQGL